MFELYDHVKIKSKNIVGLIVDITSSNLITVEDDEKKNGTWELYDCHEDDLEKID